MALRAGFIGLGDVGIPMARQRVAAGLETSVLDVERAPVDELAREGAKPAGSPRELASRCDGVGACVTGGAAVAVAGKPTYLAGGESAHLERAADLSQEKLEAALCALDDAGRR